MHQLNQDRSRLVGWLDHGPVLVGGADVRRSVLNDSLRRSSVQPGLTGPRGYPLGTATSSRARTIRWTCYRAFLGVWSFRPLTARIGPGTDRRSRARIRAWNPRGGARCREPCPDPRLTNAWMPVLPATENCTLLAVENCTLLASDEAVARAPWAAATLSRPGGAEGGDRPPRRRQPEDGLPLDRDRPARPRTRRRAPLVVRPPSHRPSGCSRRYWNRPSPRASAGHRGSASTR